MKVYILIMRRWGDPETHQYVEGLYSDLAECYIEGKKHEAFRASKYEPFIQFCGIDDAKKGPVEIPQETALSYAKLKHPQKFDDKSKLIEEGEIT